MAEEAKPKRNHLMSRKMFRDFVASHRGTERDLETFLAWCKTVEKTDWRNFGDAKVTFGSADKIGDLTCFNVGGNKYRVLAEVIFRADNSAMVLIRYVLTHKEYDKLDLG